jgi:glycosyltransferase involved in cell wall biosynthesis
LAPVRVVHLTSTHPPDDVRIFLKECRSLARAGFDVHLVAPGAEEGTRDGVVVHGFVPPRGLRPFRILRRLGRVWSVARSLDADLCHFHEPELVLVALGLKLAGARVVYDVHEDHTSTLAYSAFRSPGRRIGFRLLEALARGACDGFVAATPAIARSLPPERTVEVLNYPELVELASEPVPRPQRAGAVYVGLISHARGAREMIEAAGRLRDPAARLVLIGSFDTQALEREMRSLPGWRRVEYLGRLGRRELGERLAAAGVGLVILHPERNYLESFPTKLFEYMAAGLPAIVSDFPFFRELVEPIGCAVFVDPLDPAELAAAIDDLLVDESRAEAMGRRGARAVREGLNWEQQAPVLVALYRRLIPEGAAAASSPAAR